MRDDNLDFLTHRMIPGLLTKMLYTLPQYQKSICRRGQNPAKRDNGRTRATQVFFWLDSVFSSEHDLGIEKPRGHVTVRPADSLNEPRFREICACIHDRHGGNRNSGNSMASPAAEVVQTTAVMVTVFRVTDNRLQ